MQTTVTIFNKHFLLLFSSNMSEGQRQWRQELSEIKFPSLPAVLHSKTFIPAMTHI